MSSKLQPLPYAYTALEPHISALTMEMKFTMTSTTGNTSTPSTS